MSRPACLGLLIALALGAPAVASAAPTHETATQVSEAPRATPAATIPAPAPAQDASRYAQREKQDKQVAGYEGGSVVVIGVSGTALLVALLILLIVI